MTLKSALLTCKSVAIAHSTGSEALAAQELSENSDNAPRLSSIDAPWLRWRRTQPHTALVPRVVVTSALA